MTSFKHATPSASTPVFTSRSFTTCSRLQLSVLLESASASSLSITPGTFSVSSYDLSNNNPSSLNYNNDLHFDNVLYLVLMEILLYDQQNILSYSTCTINILLSQRPTLLSYNTTSSNVQAIVAVTLKTYDIVYDLYFDATFGTPFHIIDHGSVLYLILIQMVMKNCSSLYSTFLAI